MNRFLLLAVSVLALTAVSCKKDSVTSDESGSNGEITVPSEFNWGTSRDVSFNISVTDDRFANKIHVVSIYMGDPETGGELLAKGSATLTNSFNTKIYLPSAVSEVYVVKTAPDGSKVTNNVALTSTEVSLAVGATAIVKSMRTLSATGFTTSQVPETSPACASGAGVTAITASTSNFTAQGGGIYSVTASDVSIGLGWGHSGTLYICGKNVRLSGGNMNGLNIIITSSGSATIDGVQWNATASIKNFGALTMLGGQWNAQVMGTFYNVGTVTAEYLTVTDGAATNFGTITVSKEIWVNGASSSLTNYGTVTLTEKFNAQNGGRLNNYGSFTTSAEVIIGVSPSRFDNYGTFTTSFSNITMNSAGAITNSGKFIAKNAHLEFATDFTNDGEMTVKSFTAQNGTFRNRCKLIVLTDFYLNGATMNNQSFMDVAGNTTMNSNMNLTAGAMFRTKGLLGVTQNVNGPVSGSEWALFRVSGTSGDAVNAAGGMFNGRVLYCDGTRILDPRHFTNSAKNGCDIYIPAGDCTEGYGVDPNPTLPDTDKDGVIDVEDDYPEDPTRAFKSRQANYDKGGSTIAFEDKWPYQGDYDMNDVVISYRYEIGTNAANQVVSVDAEYKLLATGGDYNNGAGIQFNIPAANLVSISGAEAEANQDSLVVILFSNSRKEQANWNTSKSTIAESKSYKVEFRIKNGPTIGQLGIGNYNLFIWNNTGGFGRGYETHLPGRQPTKLADRALFGTGDDNSTTAKPYYDKTGLVWALEMPISNYAYPSEKNNITLTYRKFAEWARSGGKLAGDWYSNTSGEYRNQEMIFSK